MKFKLTTLVTLGFFSVLFFFQCGNNKVVPDVCFTKNILPIFISKCTSSGCHDTGSENGNFTDYEGILKEVKPYHPLLSPIYTECRGKNPSMPPPSSEKLTETELGYLKYWIHTGAKNAADCGGTVCDTVNYSFDNRVYPILKTWCIGCHNSSQKGGGYDLSTYAGVKQSLNGNKLLGSINQLPGYSSMPQNSGKILSCDINAIQKWVDVGAPNN